MTDRVIKLMHCDLNWTTRGAAAAQDWAFVDPREYLDWHLAIGTNVVYCQAYTFGGYAFYPTKLGPVAPGPGGAFLPRLFEMGRAEGLPTYSYFCVGADLTLSNFRGHWIIPGSRTASCPHGFFGPETEWTDLLCARIREFLTQQPVDWLMLDWFVYGGLKPNETRVQPAPFVAEPFERIIGRPMPDTAEEIDPAEHLAYKRAVLAEQFERLKQAVKSTSPGTRVIVNVPYWAPAEALWVDHPMLAGSDSLYAECSRAEVVDWLLSIRRPGQRVMTTVVGRVNDECDPHGWRTWYEKGCDFWGYAWGTPPDFRPHPRYEEHLAVVREAFAAMD